MMNITNNDNRVNHGERRKFFCKSTMHEDGNLTIPRNSFTMVFYLTLLLLIASFNVSSVYAAGLIQADANGNHTPEIKTDPKGIVWVNSLNPTPVVVAIGPGATAAELARLAADFPGWVFMNGDALPGNISVIHYDAYIRNPESPPDGDPPICDLAIAGNKDCFTLVYNDPAAMEQVPYRWIQFICTNDPAPGGAVCPPAGNTYVDPTPNDDDLPFYYTEVEHGFYSGPGGSTPLTFYDRPERPLGGLSWKAHLYLARWNLTNPGMVTIHDGVEWGFKIGCLGTNTSDTFEYGGVDRDKPTTEFQGMGPGEPCILPISTSAYGIRDIAYQSLSPGDSTNVTVNITSNITQALSLHELVPAGWNLTRVLDDANNFKASTNEWVWYNVTQGINKTVVYGITMPANASAGIYYINGTISNATGVISAVSEENIITDLVDYYSGLGSNPFCVETIDLLIAADDWSNNIPPSGLGAGFESSISTTELLTLGDEWVNLSC